ncbi:MAG TPA: hypothetical protein VJ826_09580 [Candidatus Polarisedimenticolaceae bacterium]|nr:hypothetical protein [Candidatus Polarisedimenticolaceae bacterium]
MSAIGAILACMALAAPPTIPSPSLAWSYPLRQPNNGVFQMLTDDAGGCAFVYGTEPGSLESARLVWVDSEGIAIFDGMLDRGGSAMRGVNDKALVVEELEDYVAVFDRNGNVATVPGLGTGNLPVENRYTDRNGMCFISVDKAGRALAVNRYRY